MKTETREIYKCEYCNKLYQIKGAALKHEKTCIKNPENDRPCFHCYHLTKKKVEYYYETYHGEDSRDLKLFYCPEKDSYLYPPQVEAKKNWFDLGDELNDPMPKECELKSK